MQNVTKIRDNVLMFLLLAFSGNPAFLRPPYAKEAFAVFTLLLAAYYYHKLLKLKANILYYMLAGYFVIFLTQAFVLKFISFPAIMGFMLKILFGFIVISVIGKSFKDVYLKVMTFVSLVSLPGIFYVMFVGDIPPLSSALTFINTKSYIFYTQIGSLERNSGMFWEPGAFSIFINVVFMLHLGEIKNLLKTRKLSVAILLTAQVTTFSTTGYITLFLIIVIFYVTEYKQPFVVLFGLVIAIISGIKVYNDSPFMREKIVKQYEEAMYTGGRQYSADRFGAFMFDLYYIKKHPLVGNGMHSKTRYADHPYLIGEFLGHGNGFSNFLASNGILGMGLYLLALYSSGAQHNLFFIVLLLICMQGEQLLNFPFFLSLPFALRYGKRKPKNENRRYSHVPQS